MILEKLMVERNMWGDRKGEYDARIKFTGEKGTIEVPLDSEKIQCVLGVVADSLVTAAKDVAENLTAEIIMASPLLEVDGPEEEKDSE
jgi:hypothetical protein